MATTNRPLTLASLKATHRFLLIGLVGLWSVVVGLAWAGIVPMALDMPLPAWAGELFLAADLLVVWFWARPRVPRRPFTTSVDRYWEDEQTRTAASLLIFLLEGVAMLGLVWTMLTGSPVAIVIAFLAVVGLVVSSPDRLARATT